MSISKIITFSAVAAVVIASGIFSVQYFSADTSSDIGKSAGSGNDKSEKKDPVFALYSEIAEKDRHSNLFLSPFSISAAFSMAYEGALGSTASQIQEVFGFEENNSKRHEKISDKLLKMNPEDGDYSLEVANALWIKDGYQIKQDYIDVAEKHYSSSIENVDFTSDEGIKRINSWTNEKTQGKIQDILEPGSTDEMTRMAVTNAAYFKGKWGLQFDPSHTAEHAFWTGKDNSVMVPMMREAAAMYNYAETSSLQALELGYLGGNISMIVLLPKEKDGISSLEQSIDGKMLSSIRSSMAREPLTVEFPRFEFETEYSLAEPLQNLGIKDAFDRDGADFGGITDEKVYLEQAAHRAFVNVNEEGTEAAAITALVFRATSGPPEPIAEFVADHPFMFIIQEKDTEEILFIGRVMDPTA